MVAAYVCRDGGAVKASPAQAGALADALASPPPSPPPGRILCTDHILSDPPRWVLVLADGTTVAPAAPEGPCGRPSQPVQQALNAIMGGSAGGGDAAVS